MRTRGPGSGSASRRAALGLLGGGPGAALAGPWRKARAQAFPARSFRVVVPTGQGGDADRLARAFDDSWAKRLGHPFEYEFYPGAAGQVGYELYSQRREPDAYNLLFGNMAPEMIMVALQKPKFRVPEDVTFFCRLDVDHSAIFVREASSFRRIEDVVAEAKKRPLNVSVSRIPHPASIGVLALGAAQGANFNLIPYGGGNPSIVAVMSGEADIGAGPVAGISQQKGRLRVLGVFTNHNLLAAETNNAPGINQVFGTSIPELDSSRAWAIHTAAIERHPDRFARLETSAAEVFGDPVFHAALAKAGQPQATIRHGDRAVCTATALGMLELADRFRSVLSAQR